MSKPSSSRLTPSRKTFLASPDGHWRTDGRGPQGAPVRLAGRIADDPLRDLAGVHYKLAALAGLLEACGSPMEAEQVAGAGCLVAEQTRRLGAMMHRLDQARRQAERQP